MFIPVEHFVNVHFLYKHFLNITQSRLDRLELNQAILILSILFRFFGVVSPPDSVVGWDVPDSGLAQDLVNVQVVDEAIQASIVFHNPTIELPAADPECAPTYVDMCHDIDMPLSEEHVVAGSS